MRLSDATDRELPELDSGVTVLRRESPRDTGLHRLVVRELADANDGLWLDARNDAATFTLYELAPVRGRLDDLRIARAFTAYQHHALARALVREATAGTDLVVVPCLPSLYRDDDVPAERAERLFDATLSVLCELAGACEARVLCTVTDDAVARDDPLAVRVLQVADRELECRRTSVGLAFEGDNYVTPGYWQRGFWQTTIPYWADLLGTVPRMERPAAVSAAGDGAAGPGAAGTGDGGDPAPLLASFDGGVA